MALAGRVSPWARGVSIIRAMLEFDVDMVSLTDLSLWQHPPEKPIRFGRILGQSREEIHCEALTRIERSDPAVLQTRNVTPPFLTEEVPCAMCLGEHPRPACMHLDAFGETMRCRPIAQVTSQAA